MSQVASGSGSGGVALSTGSSYAVVTGDANSAPFPRFDGYRDTWTVTWIAELDVYLDPAWVAGDGVDYSVGSTEAAYMSISTRPKKTRSRKARVA